ncbi:DUF6671 family protein, partial [Paraglaciecola sp.]|uniref:DUF6671 family protein n=1 Tax=Paraglaciecola sp. TaxID=1920173 RepID=UPI00273D03E2
MPHSSVPRVVALLTRHGKGRVIAPILQNKLNWRLHTSDAFDTDQLGTFSGETPRTLTASGCAEYKARLACELTGLSIGLGSEGSFDAGPYGGLLPWNQELLTCVDIDNNWQVTGIAHGPSFHQQRVLKSSDKLSEFIEDIPKGQALILYPQSRPADTLFKGVHGKDNIQAAFQECQVRYSEAVVVEYDLRAMHCPERLNRISQATENLFARLQCCCPNCKRPGFWPD